MEATQRAQPAQSSAERDASLFATAASLMEQLRDNRFRTRLETLPLPKPCDRMCPIVTDLEISYRCLTTMIEPSPRLQECHALSYEHSFPLFLQAGRSTFRRPVTGTGFSQCPCPLAVISPQ